MGGGGGVWELGVDVCVGVVGVGVVVAVVVVVAFVAGRREDRPPLYVSVTFVAHAALVRPRIYAFPAAMSASTAHAWLPNLSVCASGCIGYSSCCFMLSLLRLVSE